MGKFFNIHQQNTVQEIAEMNICHFGDCRDSMRQLVDQGVKVQTCVTSPPYFGLRDYNAAGQIGLEESPETYISAMVDVFRRVHDLLHDDGTLWLNIGDSYAANRGYQVTDSKHVDVGNWRGSKVPEGLKPKDLIGIPWMLAFALRADGWYLRRDIIWSKPNPMPESVTDRPTSSHEYIFLLSKSQRYYYDHEAVREPATHSSIQRWNQDIENQAGSERANGGAKTNGTMKAVGGPKKDKQRGHSRRHNGFNDRWDSMSKKEQASMGRNKRSVWEVPTVPYSGAHFATYPPKLIEPCILAGSRVGDIVLDPFFGSGTTGEVAQRLGRKWIGCELNSGYRDLQQERTAQQGLEL
jgi:DNA modification methylase